MTAISNYAGGVFCYTEVQGTQYVLLGKVAYPEKQGVHDIFNARRKTQLDGTPYEETLEESLATKFAEETLEVVANGQQAYQALLPASTRTVSIFRQVRTGNLEYKIYTVYLNTTAEDVLHKRLGDCHCIPCRFAQVKRSTSHDHPIESLVWIKLDDLFQGFITGNRARFNGTKMYEKLRDVVLALAPALANFKRRPAN